MKTKQEQIEQIEKVLKNSVTDRKQLKEKGECYCYAETLIRNGYGDVSEYKAEIERLKLEVKSLKQDIETATEIGAKHVELNIKLLGHERVAVRQAKIDVLNKVKERAVGLAAIEIYHICNLIDELIKEVEK